MQRDFQEIIAENLARVRGRIDDAARAAGRDPNEVTLLGVTKYVEPDVAMLLFDAGLADLAESRPQQLWQKAALLADLPVRWHMIGHLQRNKVARTVPLVDMIESVDSPRLLEAIERTAADLDRRLPVLLEVNVSGDPAKHGLAPAEVEPLLRQMGNFPHVEVRGLMCMAGLEGDLDEARRDFAALRSLRDRLLGDCPEGVSLEELSMGMSGDFEVAIEEGATIVRVGSALFEGIAP